VVVAGVDTHQRIVLEPKRLTYGAFQRWAKAHLTSDDSVVIESTTNTWHMHDELVPLCGSVTIANPAKIALIARARVKTDAKDALTLAKLHAAGLIEPVWVPPIHVREARALIAHRATLIGQQTRLKNRLHAVLQRKNIVRPTGDLFRAEQRDFWLSLDVSDTERVLIVDNLRGISECVVRIGAADNELLRLCTSEAWREQSVRLLRLPGFGVLLTMVVLSAIGDIDRFATPKQLACYAGLVPTVHQSGQINRNGHLTKAGRSELRWALVEAAHNAVLQSQEFKQYHEMLCRRMHPNVAFVVVAHKLLTAIWHVMTDTEEQALNLDALLCKLLSFAWKIPRAQRDDITCRYLTRQQLMRLGVKTDKQHVDVGYGGRRYRIASEQETMAELAAKGLQLNGASVSNAQACLERSSLSRVSR
jgi:transposase